MDRILVEILENTETGTLNIYCIFIWSTYTQRKQIFENFMVTLPN